MFHFSPFYQITNHYTRINTNICWTAILPMGTEGVCADTEAVVEKRGNGSTPNAKNKGGRFNAAFVKKGGRGGR